MLLPPPGLFTSKSSPKKGVLSEALKFCDGNRWAVEELKVELKIQKITSKQRHIMDICSSYEGIGVRSKHSDAICSNKILNFF